MGWSAALCVPSNIGHWALGDTLVPRRFQWKEPQRRPNPRVATGIIEESTDLPTDAMNDSWPVTIPQSRTTSTVHWLVHDNLENAVIRNGKLRTCRTVEVNASGGASNPDRLGCDYIVLNAGANALSVSDYGRIYDTNSNNQMFYSLPFIEVNNREDAVMTFNVSSSSMHLGACFAGRLAGDPTNSMRCSETPKSGKAGDAIYVPSLWWVDYCSVNVDPVDETSFWAVQEYATTNSGGGGQAGDWI
jgi:hypothetical protein